MTYPSIPTVINGGTYSDERGRLLFANSLDLSPIKRMYRIEPNTVELRGWQAHKNESKWFTCLSGNFEIFLIKIDDWTSPSKKLYVESFILDSNKSETLFIPGGYANGFRQKEKNSSLLVYSDFTLKESSEDDYRFPIDYWVINLNDE